MQKKIYLFFILILIGLLVSQGEETLNYSREAIDICLDMLIPSLFPFFVCSGILIYSGFCQRISKIFAPIMQPMFNINPNGSSAFILGMISGYPLGATTACQLYESGYISKSETERLLAFCNNSGPLFILCSVGVGMYMGIETGIILYISHILGAISVGVIMRGYARDRHIAPRYELKINEITFSEVFSASISNAVNSMCLICGTVLFFSVASRLILGIIPFRIPPFLYGIFEISSGNLLIASSDLSLPTKLISSAFITGFAGISVHMQVISVTAKYRLSVIPYLYGKVLHGIISAALIYTIFKISDFSPNFSRGCDTFSVSIVLASAYAIISTIIIFTVFIFTKNNDFRNKLTN